MLFVADVIPPELRRIVEFLNEQMDPAEVLAVEIRQYTGKDLTTMVPRVFGQTEQAQQKKSVSTSKGRKWDEQSFFAELEGQRGVEDAGIARAVFGWANRKHLRIWWGEGKTKGSFSPMLDRSGKPYWLIAVITNGLIQVQFQKMGEQPPFNDESMRVELLRRLNELPHVALSPDTITGRPAIPLSSLKDEDALSLFLSTMDWAISQIEAATGQG
jgi:hypothetical protein